MLASSKILADPISLSCLPREAKEQIEICFEQNTECHDAIKKMNDDNAYQFPLSAIVPSLIVVFLTGMIVKNQIGH